MARPRSPEPALFTVLERAGLAIVVLILGAVFLMLVFGLSNRDSGEVPALVDLLRAFIHRWFPRADDIGGLLIPLTVPAFAIDCYRRARRHPLTVTRNLWFLAIGYGILVVAWWTNVPVEVGSFFSPIDVVGDSRYVAGGAGEHWAMLCTVVLLLLTITLAGELTDEARRRLQREELAEAESISPREAARVLRRQRLWQAVSGPRLPLIPAALRFILHLALPGVALVCLGPFVSAIKGAEERRPAPLVISAQVAEAGPRRQKIYLLQNGDVWAGGELVLPTGRLYAARFNDRIWGGYIEGPPRVALVVEPGVTAQRVGEVLYLLGQGILHEVVFIDTTPPPVLATPPR